MRGRSSKPCPGCGASDTARPTEGVCSGCRANIERGKRLLPILDAANLELALVPRWLSLSGLAGSSQAADVVAGAMLDMMRLWHMDGGYTDLPGVDLSQKHSDGRNHGPTDAWAVPKKIAEAFKRLEAALADWVQSAHEAGLSRGRNLLEGLASGQVSPEDLAAEDLRAAVRRQDPGRVKMLALASALPPADKALAALHERAASLDSEDVRILRYHLTNAEEVPEVSSRVLDHRTREKAPLVRRRGGNLWTVTLLGRTVLEYIDGFNERTGRYDPPAHGQEAPHPAPPAGPAQEAGANG